MRYRIFHLLALALFVVACANTDVFDFRSQDRPAYNNAIGLAELDKLIDDEAVTLIDVRLLEDYQSNPVLIPGAIYNNPEQIATWSSSIPANAKVVVYCVRGAWVSQKAATYLADKGLEVYALDGGIEAWQKANSIQ